MSEDVNDAVKGGVHRVDQGAAAGASKFARWLTLAGSSWLDSYLEILSLPESQGRHEALLVFETPDTESAFLDMADGMEGLEVITANAEALAEHGVLGEAWILPPPHSLDRQPLAGLYRLPKVQLSCAGDFL